MRTSSPTPPAPPISPGAPPAASGPVVALVSAERAGYYEPHPQPYRRALEALHVDGDDALFVAESPNDVPGAAALGMPVVWHNRAAVPAVGSATPLATISILGPLVEIARVTLPPHHPGHMTVLAIVHHLERPFVGHAREPLLGRGVTLLEVDRRRGEALPTLDEIDGLVTLGGEQSVLDVEDDPVLREERDWLREAVAREVAVLGVCLGAQLLAVALGGAVYSLPRSNLGWKPMELTQAGACDPIVGGLDAPVALLWNHDAIVAPPGAVELLCASDEGCLAFRHGTRTWGLQFHPEVTADALGDWWRRWGALQLAESGVDEATARADDARYLGGQAGLSERVFGRFAAVASQPARG